MESAVRLEQAGDTEGAMTYWAQLVPALRTHNYAACGNYAKKLARALDKQGRYSEALAMWDIEFECWDKLPGPEFAESSRWDRRRAEMLRPEIRTFVARPTAGEATPALAKHEPAFGTLLGGVVSDDTGIGGRLSNVASVYGKPYQISLTYARWGEQLFLPTVKEAKEAGIALEVSWEPSNGLDAVNDDGYVRSFVRSLREYGGPVFLRFAAEMNDGGYVWNGDPERYKEKFRLIAQIVRRESADNVAMVWAPVYLDVDGSMDRYYPGDDVVDWVGLSVYHSAFLSQDPSDLELAEVYHLGPRSNPLDKVKAVYERYASRKPIMVAEGGFAWAMRKPYFHDDSDWAAEALSRFYRYLPLLYPRIKAVAAFNVDFTARPDVPSTGHYLISGNPKVLAAFRKATAADSYLTSANVPAPTLWRPMEQATLAGTVQVASYVNLSDASVARVEYFIDGERKATASEVPWLASLDLQGLSGPHTVTVRAYDVNGRLGYERSYTFDASAVKVQLDGRIVDFDQPPVLMDGRVLVPARAVLERIGANVVWEAGSKTVVVTRDGHELRLQVGNPVPLLDGAPQKELEVPAQVIGGRTLVPVRFVAENFHKQVRWDANTRTVIIEPSGPPQ